MGCFATISALGAVVTLASGGDDRLTIGTENAFPPYVMQDEARGLHGFDVDLMTEICTRATFDCRWQVTTFDQLIPGVVEGRYDVVLGGMAITAERRALVDFSVSYQESGDTEWFIGHPGAPEPAVAKTAVQAGTRHESYLRAEGYRYRSYATEAAALQALAAGQADLAFGPYTGRPDLDGLFADEGFDWLYDAQLTDEGTGIAVCKGNVAVLTRLNTALDAMAADGTLDTLESRWF
ncbi:MAG: transporter substrate-binding domain-containing protein [Paracoccaceae bacterium]